MAKSIRQIIKQVPGSQWVAEKLGLIKPFDALNAPQGEVGIRRWGHRGYIGGNWEMMGKLQFDFLVSRGLLPHHTLCDVACGSLRAGVHFIPYLEEGRYLGIEQHPLLIEEGIEKELGRELYEAKKPEFVISSNFEFEKFSRHADFVLANSLFTHLPPEHIETCLTKLRAWISPNGAAYITFLESATETENPDRPHDYCAFRYTKRQMEAFGERAGWKMEYIGDWNHPGRASADDWRSKMIRYAPV